MKNLIKKIEGIITRSKIRNETKNLSKRLNKRIQVDKKEVMGTLRASFLQLIEKTQDKELKSFLVSHPILTKNPTPESFVKIFPETIFKTFTEGDQKLLIYENGSTKNCHLKKEHVQPINDFLEPFGVSMKKVCEGRKVFCQFSLLDQ